MAPPALAITGVGLCCALGEDPGAVAAALAAGESGVRPHPPLAAMPSAAAGVARFDAGAWLKRKRDLKLMTRASQLALVAAGRALQGWPGDRLDLALFLGVGREPPDEGEAEAALAAAAREGRLDERLLAGPGRDLYPPLLPLKTLPNMALAHTSIHLGIGGENGAWAGEGEAALAAAREGWWAVAEGRAPAALIGGTDSLIDLGSARDRLRLGCSGPPGEAAAALLLETLAAAQARGARIYGLLRLVSATDAWPAPPWREQLGDCGAAEGALALALAAASGGGEAGGLAVEATRAGTPSHLL